MQALWQGSAFVWRAQISIAMLMMQTVGVGRHARRARVWKARLPHADCEVGAGMLGMPTV
eukprot:354733-Chlamydomonas_euryale.AAC.4